LRVPTVEYVWFCGNQSEDTANPKNEIFATRQRLLGVECRRWPHTLTLESTETCCSESLGSHFPCALPRYKREPISPPRSNQNAKSCAQPSWLPPHHHLTSFNSTSVMTSNKRQLLITARVISLPRAHHASRSVTLLEMPARAHHCQIARGRRLLPD